MALLTTDMQDKLIDLLVKEGLVSESVLYKAQSDAGEKSKPLLGNLTEQGIVDNELLTHAIAQVQSGGR